MARLLKKLPRPSAPHVVENAADGDEMLLDGAWPIDDDLDLGLHEDVFGDMDPEDLESMVHVFDLLGQDADACAAECDEIHGVNSASQHEDDAEASTLAFLETLQAEPPQAEAPSSSSSSTAPAPMDPISIMVADIVDPESGMGYFYYQGRSVLRIQRGKPKNSVTINCYRHPGCHLCVREHICPDNNTLSHLISNSRISLFGSLRFHFIILLAWCRFCPRCGICCQSRVRSQPRTVFGF